MSIRMILFHDVDKKISRNVVTKPSHNLLSFVLFTWHDKVSQQQSLFGDSIGSKA